MSCFTCYEFIYLPTLRLYNTAVPSKVLSFVELKHRVNNNNFSSAAVWINV